MADEKFERKTILVALPAAEDCIALQKILNGPSWKLQFMDTTRRLSLSQIMTVDAVLTDARLPKDRGWKDILNVLQSIPAAPPLVVADRLADEMLWAEVLNLGGYDVLSKPFAAMEVTRSLAAACNSVQRKTVRLQVADKARAHVA